MTTGTSSLVSTRIAMETNKAWLNCALWELSAQPEHIFDQIAWPKLHII